MQNTDAEGRTEKVLDSDQKAFWLEGFPGPQGGEHASDALIWTGQGETGVEGRDNSLGREGSFSGQLEMAAGTLGAPCWERRDDRNCFQ